jgi:oligopeptide/dipeptide ABC transporter ATP-binding protein
MRVKDHAVEVGQMHTDMSEEEILDRFRELFGTVGLPKNRISNYPHQFSGGMKQRVIIALSLLLKPSLLIADEPTTAIDVIMQDQIFKYLDEIQETLNVGMVLITHDISLVFESCDSLAIMHAGQVAERGSAKDVYANPHHPYSILLQKAFPDIRYPDKEYTTIDGVPPQNMGTVDYCTFADRCPWSTDDCYEHEPQNEVVSKDGNEGKEHTAKCIRIDHVQKEIQNPKVK